MRENETSYKKKFMEADTNGDKMLSVEEKLAIGKKQMTDMKSDSK